MRGSDDFVNPIQDLVDRLFVASGAQRMLSGEDAAPVALGSREGVWHIHGLVGLNGLRFDVSSVVGQGFRRGAPVPVLIAVYDSQVLATGLFFRLRLEHGEFG